MIGIELLRDYCWNTAEIIWPTKLVAKLKSNRILYLLSEDESEIKVNLAHYRIIFLFMIYGV